MTTCYHCGLPIDNLQAVAPFSVTIDGLSQPMCCAGCQAVAQVIAANGLSSYYQHRDALPERPREALPESLLELGLFDHPAIQKSFVRRADGEAGAHEQEAALLLEGITCAACVWLNESHLGRQPGVTAVEINYSTRRARVRWDERVTKLSAILAAVAAIGYRAYPYDLARSEALAEKERKTALWRLFVAGFGMMQVMMYAIPVYLADVAVDGDMSPQIERLMRWASLILTLPVMIYSSRPFFSSAWRDLKLRRVGMDLPVALGIGAAFAASLWATLSGQGEVYFDSVTMFVFFLLGGRYLEMMARQKAIRHVEHLARALPALATRYLAWPGDSTQCIAVADLQAGDVVLVKPGETLPADGRVIDGKSATDESLLTGESHPRPKQPGDGLTGGTINTASPLVMRVERVGAETRLAAIQRLMERASAEKPALVKAADRVAARFLFALLILAAATAVSWWFIDSDRALWVFVSVLVVSCPCALSLATPVALTVASGQLAARGVLVTRGHAIEALAAATHFVFDKTGTLTAGRLAMAEVITLRGDRDQALALAAALEQGSEHAIARAFAATKADSELPNIRVLQAQAFTGAGMSGEIDGELWRLGKLEFVAALHAESMPNRIESLTNAGDTMIALGSASGWQAFFRLTDNLRSDAVASIARLRDLGLHLSIFSGDAPATARHIGTTLGIRDARGGLTPEGKHAALSALQQAGAVAAMVGDGVNDAPVLAQAHISIAMGEGSDLARGNADIVLLGGALAALPEALSIARRTMQIVRQNLLWAFAYNFLAIPLAMFGWISPWMAGIGMSASSLLVVMNALRLQRS